MASAHRHDTPPVVDLLTDRRGHGLRFELNLLQAPECSPAGGSVHSITFHGNTATPLGPAPSSHQIWRGGQTGQLLQVRMTGTVEPSSNKRCSSTIPWSRLSCSSSCATPSSVTVSERMRPECSNTTAS